jgi:hypothetical protein
MIGVSLLAYRVSGERAYLDRAERIADGVRRRWDGGRLAQQEPGFNAILSRYLLALWAETGESGYRQFVEDYADWAWERARDPAGDGFSFRPQGNASRAEQAVLGQAAMVQVFALLTWEPWRLLRLLAPGDSVGAATIGVGVATTAASLMGAVIPSRMTARGCGGAPLLLIRREPAVRPGPGGCCDLSSAPMTPFCIR